MDKLENGLNFELVYFIVNIGMGSKVLKKAKKYGFQGGTVFIGKGTVKNSFLNFLSLYDQQKEIVLLGTDCLTAKTALKKMNKDFKLEKPNKGIAFTISLNEIIGSRYNECRDGNQERGVDSMYQLILTIVNRGKAEEVIQAATKAGSKGGTILNARGSGNNETAKLFNMEIEPEKEMVMILSKTSTSKDITDSIRERLNLDKPGNGIIFVQNVNQTYGVFE